MSGPKSANYRLTPEQRRILLEERRRKWEEMKERRLKEAEKKKKKDLVNELEDLTEKLARQTERRAFLRKENGDDSHRMEETQAGPEKVKKAFQDVLSRGDGNSGELKEQNEKLSGILREAAAQYAALEAELSRGTEQFREGLESRLAGGFLLSFANLGTAREKKAEKGIRRINEALAQISGLKLSRPLRERFDEISARADEISDPDFLGNFHSVVVLPFLRECREFEILQKEHDELIIRYAILSEECGVSPAPVPYTAEGIEFAKDEIARLEELNAEQAEKEYIKKALDEAMREIGYEMVGDRVVSRKSGRRIRHELYSMADGTAVDVTWAEDGQITMELGGIDHTDREPDAEESAQLVEDMKSFCRDYDALAERLALKGVKTQKIRICPPEAEYAQIFNANDYNLKRPVSGYSKAAGAGKKEEARAEEI